MQATAEETLEIGEVLYQSTLTPDPRSALDVLAFVLCPIEAFAPAGDATSSPRSRS